MTAALTADRVWPVTEVWDQKEFLLKNTAVSYKGGMACIDTATGGVVEPATTGANQIFIGLFAESKTGDGSTVYVNVELIRPVKVVWLNNTDTGHTAASTDLGKVCYILNDNCITMNSGGSASKAGRVWGVATINGVAMAAVELFAPANGDS